MNITFGSARHDERGKYSGGKAGDQLQTNAVDYKGEVSLQKGYIHKKGWVILRAVKPEVAHNLAFAMLRACANKNLGYDQGNRYGVIAKGIDTTTPTECDCSSLVRACLKDAGIVVGDFTTANAKSVILATKQFTEVPFTTLSALKIGDILCTKTRGHIVIVTDGNNPSEGSCKITTNYYPRYTGRGTSLVSALASVGEKDTSYKHRCMIAAVNGIMSYQGTASQNIQLVNLLKNGKCLKA